MGIDAVIAAREASYQGESDRRAPAVHSTVEDLLLLREAGYLVGPDARAVASQKFAAHRDNPLYSHAAEGHATARHWTAAEIENIRHCYRRGEHVGRIRQAFPVESAVLDRDEEKLQVFSDPDTFGAWNEPPFIHAHPELDENR